MFGNNSRRSRCGAGARMTAAAAALFTAGTLFTAGAAVAAPEPQPQPPAGMTFEAGKPGLIAADRLHVVKETGELNGDEPVMMTVRLESVLGKPGATKVSLVNSSPGEIASGVDEGKTVGIQDAYGDTWFGTAPLTSDAIIDAIASGEPPRSRWWSPPRSCWRATCPAGEDRRHGADGGRPPAAHPGQRAG